uniref:O-acyl-ADP-ribose deacylase 1 n=1 Tax=Nothobranchius furzeri TaxID=105023 RepID=A0A8C6KVX3_NOTFU
MLQRKNQRSSESTVGMLHHITGDLFSCFNEHALAHCVSVDFRMGAGIAVFFKSLFGGVAELKNQKKHSGQCVVLKREGYFVYYLITKDKVGHKPTYINLKLSLEDRKAHCVANNVTRVSMP